MAIFKNDTFHAACRIQADGAAFLLNRGFTTLGDTGTGDYLLTLEQAIDATERMVLTALDGSATSGIARSVNTSDTQIQILSFNVDGTTASDRIVSVLVLRIISGA